MTQPLPDLTARIRVDTTDLEEAVGRASRSGSMIGSAIGSAVGGLASQGLAAATSSIKDFAFGSVDAFSQLEDSTAAAGVTFGDAFGTIQAFADQAAQSFGISSRQAIEASTTFGTLGRAAGLSGGDLAGFATQMTGLAGDMASFRGTSPEQAIEAIGAALRGETEPIRAYGVLLDDATLRNRALAMGLISTTKEALTPQQKALAAQAEILAQTTTAQGDFARTADSTANTQKRLAAETEEAQAALGERLAPAITSVRELALGLVVGLDGAIDAVIRVVGAMEPWLPLIAGLATTIGVLTVALNAHAIATTVVSTVTRAWAAVQAVLNAVLAANPLVLVAALLAGLVVGLTLAWRNSETFRDVVTGAWEAVSGAAEAAFGFVKGLVEQVFGFLVTLATNFTLPGLIIKHWDTITEATDKAWQAVKRVVTTVVDAVVSFVTEMPGRFVSALSSMGQRLWDTATAAWQRFDAAVDAVVEAVVAYVTEFPGRVVRGLASLGGMLWDAAKNAFDRVREAASSVLSEVVAYFRNWPSNFVANMGNWGSALYSKGKEVVQGLIDGIKSMGQRIVDALVGLLPGPVKKFAGALGIGSPSKVFAEFGANIGEGLALGIAGTEGLVSDALGGLVPEPAGAAGPLSVTGAAAGAGDPLSALLDEVRGLRDEVRRQTDRHLLLSRTAEVTVGG